MDRYTKYLAEKVLTEDSLVTYRLLSRELQVQVNTAKQMLYEFHRSQNAKRPGAVHATYLVYGTKKTGDGASTSQNGSDGDVDMTSSAPESESLAEVVPTFTLSLVPEEQLKETVTNFDEVTSIHVYSIGPHPTKDMALLADVANQVLTLNASDDQKSLVPITNPRVRRRDRQGAGLRAATATTAATKPQPKSSFTKPAQTSSAPTKVKEEPKAAQYVQETGEKSSSSELAPAKKAAPPLKRGGSSGIMQAFSKAASKPAKPKKEAETPASATPSGEDSNVQPMSDDGEDDEELPQPKPRSTAGFKSKKQREEELRRMMEEEDEEEEASDNAESPEEEPLDEPMEEEAPAPESAKEEETEVVTASANGRRRGKRRVMRKKQIMDDQGYLVTIQEPGWESFSEDEAPPPTKQKTTSSAPAAQTAKPKKAGQKGQGSIMSFFSKK